MQCLGLVILGGGCLPQSLLVDAPTRLNGGYMARRRTHEWLAQTWWRTQVSERKPIGLTVPYREVGYKEQPTLADLEKKVKALENRIAKLEKEKQNGK